MRTFEEQIEAKEEYFNNRDLNESLSRTKIGDFYVVDDSVVVKKTRKFKNGYAIVTNGEGEYKVLMSRLDKFEGNIEDFPNTSDKIIKMLPKRKNKLKLKRLNTIERKFIKKLKKFPYDMFVKMYIEPVDDFITGEYIEIYNNDFQLDAGYYTASQDSLKLDTRSHLVTVESCIAHVKYFGMKIFTEWSQDVEEPNDFSLRVIKNKLYVKYEF